MGLKRNVFFVVIFAIFWCELIMPNIVNAATGFAWLDGADEASTCDLSVDSSGVGWRWTAAENKLTLDSAYTYYVYINCGDADKINIEVNGDVKISKGTYGSAISVTGALNIYGTGTLTLIPSEIATEYSIPTIRAAQNVTISGASIVVSAYEELNRAIVSEYGDVQIIGTAKVTATAQGKQGFAVYAHENVKIDDNANVVADGVGLNSEGIRTQNGRINVESNAVVHAKGTGTGYALDCRKGIITINNNSVFLRADDEEHFYSNLPVGTGKVNTSINSSENGGQASGGGGGCNGAFSFIALIVCVTFGLMPSRKQKA